MQEMQIVMLTEHGDDIRRLVLAHQAVVDEDAGELVGQPCGVIVTSDVEAGIALADCLIDFTRPEGTLHHLALCRRLRVGMVIGTTGFEAEGKQAIAEAAKEIPVVFAPNMSVGVKRHLHGRMSHQLLHNLY